MSVLYSFVSIHVSRLRLLPGFLPPEEADWIFSRLLAELPWSQKTNYRQGELAAVQCLLLLKELLKGLLKVECHLVVHHWLQLLTG